MVKRKPRGEGTIYLRTDGSWSAQITLPNGKKKTRNSKSQKVVRDWLQQQRNTVHQGTWTDTPDVTLGGYLERYLSDVVAHTLRPTTQESYFILTRTHILPELGSVKLTALRPEQLQNFYATKLSKGYSKRTVQYLHSIIHKALEQALQWGLVPRNVADAVQAPRPSRKAPEMLSQEQLEKFIESTQDHPLYALWVTAITTGMRKAELLGLRWSDVDFDSGIIHINQVAQSVHHHGILISEPKTEKSRRSIDLPRVTVAALRLHKQKQEGIRASVREWKNLDLVFPTKLGTPIGSSNVLTYFHAALEKAGLPKVNFHSLRHLHSTLLLMAGIHPKIVQERLGHSRIDTTMDIYSHVIPGMQKPAAATMDQLLGSAA